MAKQPLLEEMFSDAADYRERGDRLEALKSALNESIRRHDSKTDRFVPASQYGDSWDGGPIGIVKGAGPDPRAEKLEQIASKFSGVTKGLTTDQQTEVAAALEELRSMRDDMSKDVTVASPGNLHPYDLEAPAKQLVPRFSPLRNELARVKGQGVAREFRRILGYSNTGMGGVANLTPFFNSESDTGAPTFGQLALRRGQKISYAMDVKTIGYVEMSLSDLVTWKAQFSNLGFENTRALSQMALLWAHLLGEERAILYGRGTGSGYEGAVAAPAITSIASAASGSGSGFGTTEFVKVTSYTGQGESLPSTEATNAALTAGRPLIINLTSQPTGAIAYGVYISTTTNTETFQGFYVPQANSTGNQLVIPTFVTGGAVPPVADGSALSTAYDGFLSVLSDPAVASYVARFDAVYGAKSGANIASVFNSASGFQNWGDTPWQDAFAGMFAAVYADPDEVWLNVQQRRQLGDFVRNAGTGAAAYRIVVPEAGANGFQVGAIVTGLHNESSPTDKLVDLRIHPYMPLGASFIRSRVLNIPNSGIGDTSQVISVQEYMGVDWPEVQFTYDASTYWYGSLLHYAPKWNACILGLQ